MKNPFRYGETWAMLTLLIGAIVLFIAALEALGGKQKMTEQEVRELVEAHWEFLERWLHMVYVDAGIHFFKHGVESTAVKADEGER